MNICFSPLKNLSSIKFSQATSNPIRFKGVQDTFEKSETTKEITLEVLFQFEAKIKEATEELSELEAQIFEYSRKKANPCNISYSLQGQKKQVEAKIKGLKEEYEKLIGKINPNSAFLSDDKLTHKERLEILHKDHPEIIVLYDVSRFQNDSVHKELVYKTSPYFIKSRSANKLYMDTSFAPNVENYRIISDPDILSHLEFCKRFKTDKSTLNRYIREGYITEEQLQNLRTGKKDTVHLINLNNPINQEGLERYNAVKALYPKKSRYLDRKFLPATYLSKLGYGSQKEIFESVRYKRLPGEIKMIETENGPAKMAFVNVQKLSDLSALKFLKNENKKIIDLETLARLTNSDITGIEEALLNGEIAPIPEYLFDSEENEILFSLQNKKNIEFIEKKQFEANISKIERKKTLNENTSLRNVISWALCPNTRNIARKVVAMFPEIKEIFEKQDLIRDYYERKAKDDLRADENIPYLTKEEKIKARSFYKEVWSQSGTEEYKQAITRAKQAILEYKEGGLENVQDETIKSIIQKFYESKGND